MGHHVYCINHCICGKTKHHIGARLEIVPTSHNDNESAASYLAQIEVRTNRLHIGDSIEVGTQIFIIDQALLDKWKSTP